jgi:leucyl aminopeptidase (aminopeptidase T)
MTELLRETMALVQLPSNRTTRRQFLKKGGAALIACTAGCNFLNSCAPVAPRREEPAPPLPPGEQRDRAIDDFFKTNLGVRRDERVLVFTDNQNPVVAREAQYVAKRGTAFAEIIFLQYPRVGPSAAEPPKELWEKAFGPRITRELEEKDLMRKILQKKLEDKEAGAATGIVSANRKDAVDVVIGLAWTSTSHTFFQRLLTGAAGARYASLPAFNPGLWQTAMSADWKQLDRKTAALKNTLSGAISARIHTPNGTNLSLDLRRRDFVADTNLLNQPGRFGILPSGALSIAPVEGASMGKMVIEPGLNPGFKNLSTLEVKEGKVTKMSGDTGTLSWLESVFYRYPEARTLGVFSAGTNDRAKVGTNLLESQKALGTIHLALGDNRSIGGKTSVPFQLDLLFQHATAEITLSDGRTMTIMQDGNLLS